jgi:hypothetical protein
LAICRFTNKIQLSSYATGSPQASSVRTLRRQPASAGQLDMAKPDISRTSCSRLRVIRIKLMSCEFLPDRHEFVKIMIISLSLTQTHNRETPKQLKISHELMNGPVLDHHAHSIYPPPRRSNPEITRRPWRMCSCLTQTVSTHRTVHLSLLHALVPL